MTRGASLGQFDDFVYVGRWKPVQGWPRRAMMGSPGSRQQAGLRGRRIHYVPTRR
jgi:hypothetical protein